uniref:Secretin n=1 Tax=Gopherus evgoodei TaxID=1825980 RepID=A0A8C4WCD0_9SAUR
MERFRFTLWAKRHADGVFNSELSKMNENAYVQKLVKSLVGLNQRYQRHSDGMFTSELSKMRGNAQVQKLIKSLVGYKRRRQLTARKQAARMQSDRCPSSREREQYVLPGLLKASDTRASSVFSPPIHYYCRAYPDCLCLMYSHRHVNTPLQHYPAHLCVINGNAGSITY